ncbi:MAG TPA: TlpA disulfide reductase family protein [Solirubrobacteraceae bacterium]|nr:TlpA disulfide reductase family protein [Solirubrobacteraceae bacterium]
MRRLIIPLLGVGLIAVLVIGLTQAGSKSDQPEAAAPTFDLHAAQRALEGSPPQLAALHAQAGKILDSGFDKQLDKLKGRPVVINKWASWCRPCRAEFPVFQQVATDRGKEIAFIGVNAADKRPAAEKFLADRPLPYPSYEDPDEKIAQQLKIPKFFPMTLMIDADGKTFIKSGEYTSTEQLQADIDKYLG